MRDFSNHPITSSIGGNHIPVLVVHAVLPNPTLAPPDETLRVTALMRSQEGSWAETDYRKGTPEGPHGCTWSISVASVAERKLANRAFR